MNIEDIKYLNQKYNECSDINEYLFYYKLVTSGIPLAYRSFTRESMSDPKITVMFKKIDKYLKVLQKNGLSGIKGKGLYFFGNRGSGKTSLMCILLKEIIKLQQYSCKFITFQDLVNILHFRTSYENSIENPTQLEEEVTFLAIDGFGEDVVQNYNKGKFINLLKKRYFQLKPTLITSVLNPLAISAEDKFGNSIGSLLNEIMVFVDHSNLSDYRKKL